MNIKRIRKVLRDRAAGCEKAAAATKYVERRRWLEGRAHGMRLALRLIEQREAAISGAGGVAT